MKIKKGFKLLSVFLAICAILLYLPNNIVVASAEQPQETDYAEETLCVDVEESETDMGIIGGMTEIPSEGGNTAEILSNDFVHALVLGGGGAYYIQDGIYALENVGNDGLWLDIQQDKYLPGYHMQQYAADGNPAQTFDRSCLFKITRRSSTNSYIIRSMLNNRLTFYFSGNEVLTKEIPPNDADVHDNDTFRLVYDSAKDCFVIKPYSSSNVVAANNTTASGMAGAPNSYLIKSTESASGNQSRWYMYQYTGETKSGVIPVFSPSTTSGALIENNTYNVKIVTWTTEIGKNTPYALVHPDSQGMATGIWDASTCTLTLTTEKAGPFKLRTIIRADGTTTAFRTFYGNYPIIPSINGETRFIQNVGTEKYVDIEGPSTVEGAFIQQWQFNGKLQSKWLFGVQSGGYFTIKSHYSNMYIGVDPTNTEYIRQYDSIENNTLWRFIETSSGNYKLVCKSLEASGYVLATQSQTSGNGSNLMMTPYTDDTNYRDEWHLRNISVIVEFSCDNGFVTGNMLTNESVEITKNRISNEIIIDYFSQVQQAFLQTCNVNMELNQTVIQVYTSDADLCNSDINQMCTCIQNNNCLLNQWHDPLNNNSVNGFEYDAHCKSLIRLRNNLVANIPDNTIRITYTGHEICYNDGSGCNPQTNTIGLADFNYPIIAMTKLQGKRYNTLILAHELTHLFGITHHERKPGTTCIMDSERYNGIQENDVTTYWCDDCINTIRANADKFY